MTKKTKPDVKSIVATLTSVKANTQKWFSALTLEQQEVLSAAKEVVLAKNLNALAVAKNIRLYLQENLVLSIPSEGSLARWLRSKGE